jgi:hypothetical protein
MSTDDRLARILGVRKKRTHRVPTSRPPEEVTFNGVERNKREVQDELNSMECAERVTSLTSQRQQEVVALLQTYVENDDIETGVAIYAEYREAINDTIEDELGDRVEAFWCHSAYLKTLMKRKQVTELYEQRRTD